MAIKTVLFYLFVSILTVPSTSPSFVFHVNTGIKFMPDDNVTDNYFGYSTLLTANGLFIGAPKAINNASKNRTGMIFYCSLKNLTAKNITCKKMELLSKLDDRKFLYFKNKDLKNDSWFGASMAVIKDTLLVTAPRLKSNGEYNDDSIPLLQGASYMVMSSRFRPLEPLKDGDHKRYQLYSLSGTRTNYGSNSTDIYYYSLGQFGFSMAVTKMNTLIFGAPGLLKSAGGIISYSFNPKDRNLQPFLQPITNPYNTSDLDPDDAFGYSVDSGTFEINGSVLYVGGAPRAELARGKVLVIAPKKPEYKEARFNELESNEPLNVRYKLMGPQIGSYFGASVCCMDIDGDGVDDLLVGAPTFVEKKDGELPYDQGAVFIYMTREADSGFFLEPAGYVSGSEKSGAKFGTAIAVLGDVDGDNYRDVAIGAPWEDNGVGAVYIYMGYKNGLKIEKVQRIQAANARGFGWSISKGFDVDKNSCNDLLVGAFGSATAYLYRCVPTMQVKASIQVANGNRVNLPINATTFTARFCVSSPPIEPKVKLLLNATITADADGHRSTIVRDSQYQITVRPDEEICNEKTFIVDPNADLLKPISLNFALQENELMNDNSTTFLMNAARLCDDSDLNITLPVQLMRDCGEDLVCSPWLNIDLEALDNPYIPGKTNRLGIKLSTWNTAEPAYGLKVMLTLPLQPKRTPSECILDELVMSCDLPQPFGRNEIIAWEIHLDYNLNISSPKNLIVKAEAFDSFHRYNITSHKVYKLSIDIAPEATFVLNGKATPNDTITILRSNLANGKNVTFQHVFAITNKGPSDWFNLSVNIWIPEKACLKDDIDGCEKDASIIRCHWSIPAKVSFPVTIPLQMDLDLQGNYLKQHIRYNATTALLLQLNDSKLEPILIGYEVTTTFILEPADLLWCIVVPCVFLGLILLAIVIRIMQKCGFFLRAKRQTTKRFDLGAQHTYRTIQTSDSDPSSQLDKDDQHFGIEENGEVNLNIDLKRTSYHVMDI